APAAAPADAPLAPAAPIAAPTGPSVVVATQRPAEKHRDLWQRMRAGFTMPELGTALVAEKERFYLQRPDALQRMFARGGRYLHYIVEEIEKRGMPMELALLPFVESAMNPVALSSAQAAGLWQFIPSTGKQYELAQNWWVDNRRDVVKSTHAALDYLQKIHEMHDRDWFLALASYNWGENAVARAVKNNRARGLPTDYLSLNMPAETRHYVPKLIALKRIVLRADELGVALPEIPNRPYFATIEKTRPIDLKLAAQFSGLSVDEFVALNPAHNRPVIAASRNNEIRIPADRVDEFVRAMERHDRQNKPLASWQPYTLKPGETLDEVARRGGVGTAELLRANGLSANRKILPGTQLIAPQASVKDERQVESFEGPKVYEQVTVPAVYHRVGKRDSLTSIADSYDVGVAQLRAWNGAVKTAKPGTSVLVRPATTQTVLSVADGPRRVVSRAALPQAPVQLAQAEEPAAPAPPAAPAAPAPRATAPTAPPAKTSKAAPRAKAPAPVARASAPSGSVKAVYKPPRPQARTRGTARLPRT
ncbi:MAG: transglycosylase SLT domain-containing protein, partial [Burkholderiales bacterium]|nr:transglycosylase SLT domain-containing protein [Burkholderiales bacterium]